MADSIGFPPVLLSPSATWIGSPGGLPRLSDNNTVMVYALPALPSPDRFVPGSQFASRRDLRHARTSRLDLCS